MARADYIDVAREALGQLHSEFGGFVKTHGPEKAEESPAHADVIDFPQSESVHTVYGQALTLLEIAGDHLTAFIKVISEPCETIAPWTCTRSLLEAAALASWLTEPGVPVKERVERGLAFRYEGLVQQVKFARSADGLDPQLALDRIGEVTRGASKLGIQPVFNKNQRQIGIGQRMPSITMLVKDVLQQEEMYRLLSAVAHGHFWVIHQVSFRVLDGSYTTERGARLKPMTKAVNPTGVAYLAAGAAEAFGRAAWYQCMYSGWDRRRLAGILSDIFDRLNLREDRRFWLSA